ncbi:peroxiredoxin [Candidatus Dependentiae bacterium]
MICIGKKAPDFSCEAVVNKQIKKVNLSDFDGKYKVIFFYPLDFTFVCPTELHAFQALLPEFEKRNAQVLGVSVDSAYSHLAWLNTPKNKGGIEGVTYPILSDINKNISKDYGVLDDCQGVAFRGAFILDKENTVQSVLVNNLSLGRNISEFVRLIDALQFSEKNGQVCPANWNSGKQAMDPTSQGLLDYFGDK